MQIGDLEYPEFWRRLRDSGISVKIGPIALNLQVNVFDVGRLLHTQYTDYPLVDTDTVCLAHVRIELRSGIRRWLGPQVSCLVDSERVFEPMPLHEAFPMLEWGMNWCVATRVHTFLMLHSAVIERNGRAFLLPAWSGSGKSTLCAALIQRGWRYFSDEFAMIRLRDGAIAPLPRPLPLKNESVAVIREFAPGAILGPLIHTARKGDLAHLQPPSESVFRAEEPAMPGLVVFPNYEPGEAPRLEPIPKSRAFLKMAGNSFNFHALGGEAFECLTRLVDSCDCYVFTYSELLEAVKLFEELAAGFDES